MWRRKSVPAWLGEELVPEVHGRALSATAWTAPAHPSAEGNSTWSSAMLGGAQNEKTVGSQTIVHPFPPASRGGGPRCRRSPVRLPRGRHDGAPHAKKRPRLGGWRGQFREVVTYVARTYGELVAFLQLNRPFSRPGPRPISCRPGPREQAPRRRRRSVRGCRAVPAQPRLRAGA